MSSSRMPEEMDSAWICDRRSRRFLRLTSAPSGGPRFFAPNFALTAPNPWLSGEEIPEPDVSTAEILPPLAGRTPPSAAAFDRTFEDITARRLRGEFQKVVPLVSETLTFAAEVSWRMFPRAWGQPPPERQWAYGFQRGSEGLAGLTPELLFEVKDGVLTTMALAGTGPALGPALLDDAKERLEHQLVVDHLTGVLAPWGEPEVGATTERAYGALKHLLSPIKVRLNRAPEFLDLVRTLHPTAALGGYPRRPALAWLEAQEFHRARGRFGAPFGFIDGDAMICLVAIRGVQWRGRELTVAAGCGVVDGSDLDREWAELELKRRAIFTNLGLDLA